MEAVLGHYGTDLWNFRKIFSRIGGKGIEIVLFLDLGLQFTCILIIINT